MAEQRPERRSILAGTAGAAGPRRRPQQPLSGARSALLRVLGTVSPVAITALIALAAARLDLPGPVTGLPLALLVIVVIQLGGLLVARESELWPWFRVWLVILATTLTLLPALAIQAASSRVPFTALSNGSAGLVIVSSLGSLAAILGIMVLAAGLAADAPENAGILFTPALVLVPAVLGAPGELTERSGLLALGQAGAVATVVMTIGWLLPKRARPLVGLAALGVQFVVLWLLGFGPVVAPDRGFIVPALSVVILIVTVVAAAAAPIAALVTMRFAQTVRSQTSQRRSDQPDPSSRSEPRRDGGQRQLPPSARRRDR